MKVFHLLHFYSVINAQSFLRFYLLINNDILKLLSLLLPVPLQSVLVVAVEEVRLRSHGPDVRVYPQELQQSPGASFLHPDDDRLRQLLAPGAVGEAGHGARIRNSVSIRVQQVSGRRGPDGRLLVVALHVLPGLRLGQQSGHQVRPPARRRSGLLAPRGVHHHQAGHGGAVAHAGVEHANPDYEHDDEQEKFLLHGAGPEGMQAVENRAIIFHKPSWSKSDPSGA